MNKIDQIKEFIDQELNRTSTQAYITMGLIIVKNKIKELEDIETNSSLNQAGY